MYDARTIYERPAELLQNLIRFNTTNPPGNELGCVNYINSLLVKAGFKTTYFAKEPDRPSLIARLKGRDIARPLLLYGAVNVATTADQKWTWPPFEGKMIDGWVWGRGALDMKGSIAMMLAAFLRAKAEGLAPAGDIVLAILCDGETGGDLGAKYLVENHAEQFEGIRYALGGFGGFTVYVDKRRFYAIRVAEKQSCWMKATLHGPGGHGSVPMRGGTMVRLAQLLQRLDRYRLPVHVTPVAHQMIESIAAVLTPPMKSTFCQLLAPALTDSALDRLGQQGILFDALLHNTVNATVVRGGEQINVIPSEITLELDGRLLPGYTPDDMVAELQQIVGDDIGLEVIRYQPGPAEPDMGLFAILTGILREDDPGAIPLPFLVSVTTDARHFSRLGIQTYGFTPMNLPKEFSFFETIHGVDERIPVEAVEFGTNVLYKALQVYK